LSGPITKDDLVGNCPKCNGILYEIPTALSTSARSGNGRSPIEDLNSFNFSNAPGPTPTIEQPEDLNNSYCSLNVKQPRLQVGELCLE